MNTQLIHEQGKIKALKLLYKSKLQILLKKAKTMEELKHGLMNLRNNFMRKAGEIGVQTFTPDPTIANSFVNFARFFGL